MILIIINDLNQNNKAKDIFTNVLKPYLNSKNLLIISKNVKVKDIKGTIFADKLLFDIKTKRLKISSSNKDKINANIKVK